MDLTIDFTSSATTTTKSTTVQNNENSNNNNNNNLSIEDKMSVTDKNTKMVRLQHKKIYLEKKLIEKYQEFQQILHEEQLIIGTSKANDAQQSQTVIGDSINNNSNNLGNSTKDQPSVRRKIGTSFKLAENLLLNTGRIPSAGSGMIASISSATSSNSLYPNSNSVDEEKQQKQIEFNNLLLDKQINQEISKASFKLSQDPQQHKSIRRMHKKNYEMTENKLTKIEKSINQLLLNYDINPAGGVTPGSSSDGVSHDDLNSSKNQSSIMNSSIASQTTSSSLSSSHTSINNNNSNGNPVLMERCNSMKSSNSASMIDNSMGMGLGANQASIHKMRTRHDSFNNYINNHSNNNNNVNYEYKSMQYLMQPQQLQQQSLQKQALNLQLTQQQQQYYQQQQLQLQQQQQQHNKQMHLQQQQHQQQQQQSPSYNQKQFQQVMLEYFYNEPMTDIQTSIANPAIVDDLYVQQQQQLLHHKFQQNNSIKQKISPQTSPRFQHPHYQQSSHLHHMNYQQQLQLLLHQQQQNKQKHQKQLPSPSPSSSSSNTSSSAVGAMAPLSVSITPTSSVVKSPRNSPQHRGLGGYWMTLDNNEKVWCSVDNMYSSLDRNKIHNNNHHHHHHHPQNPQIKLKSQSNVATMNNKMLRSMVQQQQPIPMAEAQFSPKSISLGNIDFLVNSSGIKHADDLSDTMSVTSVSSENKKHEKIWRETSLDTPNIKQNKQYVEQNNFQTLGRKSSKQHKYTNAESVNYVGEMNYMMNNVVDEEKLEKECLSPPVLPPIEFTNDIDKDSQQRHKTMNEANSENIGYPPNELSRTYASPNITQATAAAHQDMIQMESPKNMTVVQQGKIMPYKEITKPFEMSDFYKYSTKFRQKQKPQLNDLNTPAPSSSSLGSAAHQAQQIQKIIYQPPNPSICHPIINNFN